MLILSTVLLAKQSTSMGSLIKIILHVEENTLHLASVKGAMLQISQHLIVGLVRVLENAPKISLTRSKKLAEHSVLHNDNFW